jgi:glycerol-3-phosphate cytidylyltransferase
MYRIGYAPGAFDLLHIGHLDLFRQAKSHCDFLIVGVASDEIVLEYKGCIACYPAAGEARDYSQHPIGRCRLSSHDVE